MKFTQKPRKNPGLFYYFLYPIYIWVVTVNLTISPLEWGHKSKTKEIRKSNGTLVEGRNKMKMSSIKSKMGKKAIAALMAVIIMSAPVTNLSFATEGAAGEPVASPATSEQAAPEKPAATSHKDNSKIEEYNKKVDEYNESARQHNESVDREYEAAVEETNRMNEEIDKHNTAEQQRVKDAEERNAKAQSDADEANLKIDEENAAEKARVDQINKEEEEKANASQEARLAAEAQNKETEEHNAKVEKYNADMEQYKKDLAQYEYDLKIEAQILKLGYESVEQYNAKIDKAYNTPAKESVEKNANAKEISVNNTYTVQEAAEKSGVKVIVHIEHVFQGTDLKYTEDFEIDANDVITVNPISTIGEQTSPGYATFYYNTDEQHQMGYWMEAYSSIGSNAKYNQSGWDCGDTHVISYKDGKNHASDKEEIVVEYNYMWNPLKVYKTYNTPNAPTEPENPGEARALVDLPELYAPNYVTYEEKQHVTAELEEISAADLWDYIASPEKKEYMSLMDHMDLFDVPEKSVVSPVEKKSSPVAANATIANELMPLADVEAELVSENAVPTTIMDSETPQSSNGAWALINLLCALATAILSLIMMIRYFGTRREGILRFASLIPAIGAIAAFILTENMANSMIITDKWTVMMVIILAVQTGVALLVSKKDSSNEDALINA